MTVLYHPGVIQGSDEWISLRCGILTASEMKLILTPTLKVANNDKSRAHLWELAAQRITRYVEPHYISDDMLRGQEDEIEARDLYAKHFSPVETVGFITRDDWGFTLGYSPDALVGKDGLIECKSRRQKFQIETIVSGEMPDDYLLQVQTGLLVSGREWLDFISYSGGLPMARIRVYPDEKVQAAIIEAATAFEIAIAEKMEIYRARLASGKLWLVPTMRRVELEMHL